MSGVPDFVDTNVLVYAFSSDRRAARAEELLAARCSSGVQTLNEFANVARRKLGMGWDEVEQALSILRRLLDPIATLDLETHLNGLALCRRHHLPVNDGLIVAAALRLGCRRLWSEDLQHGLVIDGRLSIENPFRPTP